MATNNYRNQAKIQETHKTAVNRASWHAFSQGILVAGAFFSLYWLYLGVDMEKSVTAGVFTIAGVLFFGVFAWRDAVLFNRYREMTQEKTPPQT